MDLERTRPYRGADRRGGFGTAALGETFVLGAALLLAAFAGVALVAGTHPVVEADLVSALSDFFETLSLSFAVGTVLLCLLLWRLNGDSTALWIGTAALVFGVVVIGLAQLGLPLLAEPDRLGAVVPATYAAGLVGTISLLVIALVVPPVDTRLRAWRVAVTTLALVGFGALILDSLAPIQRLLTDVHPVTVRPGVRWAARPWLSTPWALLGLGFMVRGMLRGQTLLAWSGLTITALAVGELAGALQQSASDLWLPGGHLLRAVGFLLVIIGCSSDLRRSYVDQRSRLFQSQVAIRTVQTREQGRRAGLRRREHDLQGSLMAIEGAANTLERHNKALSSDAREALAGLLSAEINRLKRIVAPQPTSDPFALPDIVRSALAGSNITIEGHAPIAVIGSPTDTTEVVRELVSVATFEVGALAGPVSVEVIEEDGWGVVRLRFRPASVPRHERGALLARRLAGTVAEPDGDNMGLQVAGQLVHDQGGELTLHECDDGELTFELRLPVSQSAP